MGAAPTDLTIRRSAVADATALAALVAVARAEDGLAGSSDPSGQAVSFLARIAPQHTALATRGDTLVGFASPEVKTVYVIGSERRRGIGRALLAEAEAIERERRRPNVLLGVVPDDRVGHAFVKANGFALHSIVWELALRASREVPPPSFPAGFTPRAFTVPGDVEAVVALYNAVFADHPTPLIMDIDGWEDADDPFDPTDVLLLAEARRDDVGGERLIGFCWTDPGRMPDGSMTRSEVFGLGVARDRRGLGLGRELLRWGIGRLRALRPEDVTLTVNGHNEGALRLYESEGFTRIGTRERWARPIEKES